MPEDSLLTAAIETWLTDEEGDVAYAEQVEGVWAVRMRQTVRDATTVWWTVGDYSIAAEAYVLPAPEADPTAVYRLALMRNSSAWRAHFALDAEGALVIRGRIALDSATFSDLDLLLGEIYQLVELSFRPLVRLAFAPREKRS
ncbi:hypothetical protein BH23ACT5_BH23ACT5_11980 [soil metagenome]